jgi:hypothetical protein
MCAPFHSSLDISIVTYALPSCSRISQENVPYDLIFATITGICQVRGVAWTVLNPQLSVRPMFCADGHSTPGFTAAAAL